MHARLVQQLIAHVKRVHVPERGLLVLADHESFGRNSPPRINGFTPDLFASDLPATFEILGEAKTMGDLQTDRSHRQIAAFLDYLAVRASSRFYLCVPPLSKVRATSILRSLMRPEHESVLVEVLDGT